MKFPIDVGINIITCYMELLVTCITKNRFGALQRFYDKQDKEIQMLLVDLVKKISRKVVVVYEVQQRQKHNENKNTNIKEKKVSISKYPFNTAWQTYLH